MKTNQRLHKTIKAGIFAAALFCSASVFAQVKIGDNPTSINPGSALEIESTNKGLLMPRVALTNTTTWGLAGTAAAGMHVYNTNTGITSTNTTYPTLEAKIGEYYWDGTGWVALAPVGSQTSPVQLKIQSNADQNLTLNSTNNTIIYGNTVFDVGINKVGNTAVIPSTGLYELTAYAQWTAANATGGYGVYLYINNVFAEQFAGSVITNNIIDSAGGRIVRRLNTGDVVSVVMLTQQTSGSFTLSSNKNSFTVIKLSN